MRRRGYPSPLVQLRVTLSDRLQLAWSRRGGHDCLRIRGLSSVELDWLAGAQAGEPPVRLAVFPSELLDAVDGLSALQPMAGRLEAEGDAVCFIPRFPFVGGTSYSVLVERPLGDERSSLRRPDVAGPPVTHVVGISPTAAELPLNQLKLYVQFSNPMSEGWARRGVHVLPGGGGEPLEGVFLDMNPELWDTERRRLTLLLDPGRIKRGLAPNLEAGYPLVQGDSIVVAVDTSFRDAEGRPLRAGAERRYTVGPPVRRRIEPAAWRLHRPTPGSTRPLVVEFDRPLDRALLERSLLPVDDSGIHVAGQSAIGEEERSWQFVPQLPWSRGRFALLVDARLEDLAGNSIARVFDRDLTRDEDAPLAIHHAEVAFRIGPE